MNRRTGEEERKQDFINLDESECFDVVLNDTCPMSMAGAGFGVLLEVRQAANVVLFFFTPFSLILALWI